MPLLKIRGSKLYVQKLEAHLHKEHPSTKGKTSIDYGLGQKTKPQRSTIKNTSKEYFFGIRPPLTTKKANIFNITK